MYWILQGNPAIYDTYSALEAGTVDRWRVVRYLHDISRGDEFALWISGPDGGVIALGEITERPMPDTDADPFWVDPAEGGKSAWWVGIRISRRLDAPVSRIDLRADPGFAGSAIIRMPGGGNPFPVTSDEWLILQSRITAAENGSRPARARHPLSAADVLGVLNDEQAIDDLEEYFSTAAVAGPPAFTGSRFNIFDSGGARPDVRDKITAADLIAVQCLGVTVPPAVCLDLLDGHLGVTVSAHLQHVPCGIALGDSGAHTHLQPGSPADAAWRVLTQQHGVDWVIAGRLLARKRPALIPVYDGVVRCAIGFPANAWLWLDDLLCRNDAVRRRLSQLHRQARVPELVPLLRVLDVVIWMRHRRDHQNKDCPGVMPSV